jgi:hypothetical protein
MLTIFSTPKPFEGHIGVIQRNAIQSWKCIHPDVEIILFGNDPGATEICEEMNLRHVKDCPRNEFGTKLLRGIFGTAQELARFDRLCYVNCDIMLMPAFGAAVDRVATRYAKFLMIGQRWNLDLDEQWNFGQPDWPCKLEALVARNGSQVGPLSIDYFVFSRRLFLEIPDLVIGRIWWDHWLIWRARSIGAPVVDATAVVKAVHQNHDYSYHPAGAKGVWQDEQAQRNYQLAGGKSHLYTLEDATHRLTVDGVTRNLFYPVAPLKRRMRPLVQPVWHSFLNITRPVRHAAGIRRRG